MSEKLRHVQRLLYKADNDLRSARALIETEKPATDVICFHCQQAVEKILKAWLHWHDIPTPRTHNLSEILALCRRTDDDFARLQAVEALTPYAVELRYAEAFYVPSLEEARSALALAESAHAFVQGKFAAIGVAIPEDFPSESGA